MKLGIDPGISGALALVTDDFQRVVFVVDMPVTEKTHGKGKMVNPFLLTDIVDEAIELAKQYGEELIAVVEQVSAMPGQGVSSTFSFGRSLGVIEGVLGGLMVKTQYVTPQRWKKAFSLVGKEKDASRTKAISLFPEIKDNLKLKKHNGRSDAIFIAGASILSNI